MYSRSDPQQQWSVHAEFTISHDGLESNVEPQTHTERDENGVRMVYSWTSQPSTCNEPEKPPGYGFQRGNLLFTSTPPRRNYLETPINKMGLNVQDSGYGSDLLSPNSSTSHKPPPQPYNRRCRSTCSIVLSTNFEKPEETADSSSQCGRTQSLRCQTPTMRTERKDTYYGCGDPWCYHAHTADDFSCKFTPVPELDESSTQSRRPSRASTFATREKTKSPQKDASVQTFEMIDKCTSPFMRMDSFEYGKEDETTTRKAGSKKRSLYNSRRKTEPVFQRTHSPSTFTPDSLESQQVLVVFIRFEWVFVFLRKKKNELNRNTKKQYESNLTCSIW